MGFTTSASLVVGISMAKLFKDFKEISEAHDEHDKFGRKTGRQFKINKLIGTLPNNREVIISEEKDGRYGWKYDWYDSIGFDGSEYVGDVFNVTMEMHKADYECNDLHQMIMGINVCSTGSSDYSDGEMVVKVDEATTNSEIDKVRKQLAEVFGYTGEIKLYLLNNLSY